MAEITYLMDDAPPAFFAAAKQWFAARSGSTVVETIGTRSLAEVLTDLRTRATGGTTYSTINLVSRPSVLASLRFPVSVARRDNDGGRTTLDTLKHSLLSPGANGYPAVLGPPAVTAATSVVLYGSEVGRDAAFLALLGQLFGPELTIYAPMRAGTFATSGSRVEHRLLRTWSTPFDRDVSATTDWGPVRTRLADALVAAFGTDDPAVESAIRAAAEQATTTTGGSYVESEPVTTADDPGAGGMPLVGSVLGAGTRDDTTVALPLTAADFRPAGPGVWRAWIARLVQVLADPVSIDNGAQFRRTVIRAGRTASVTPLVPTRDPTPVPDVGPDPAPGPQPDEDDMAFFGKYRATVIDSADPTTSGRLRVDVPAVGVSAVWAEASIPPVPTGLLRLPQSGDTVWVEFEAGDQTKPIWTGATWDSGGPPAELTLEAFAELTLRAPLVRLETTTVQVDAAMVNSSAVLKADTVIATSVVAASYTPGAGNLY
jgi:hypothetical protein